MYACMTPVGFDTFDKFENHCFTVWNEFSLDWLCVARLTRLLLCQIVSTVFVALRLLIHSI